jgi:hypothetical protein
MTSTEIYQLDWGKCTVEGYNPDRNIAKMVFNYDVTDDTKVKKVIQLVVGRVVWCSRHFPMKTKISMSFDFRGQGIFISTTDKIRDSILKIVSPFKIENELKIDFLI